MDCKPLFFDFDLAPGAMLDDDAVTNLAKAEPKVLQLWQCLVNRLTEVKISWMTLVKASHVDFESGTALRQTIYQFFDYTVLDPAALALGKHLKRHLYAE